MKVDDLRSRGNCPHRWGYKKPAKGGDGAWLRRVGAVRRGDPLSHQEPVRSIAVGVDPQVVDRQVFDTRKQEAEPSALQDGKVPQCDVPAVL